MTTNVLNTNISKVENKISDNSNFLTTQEFNKLMTENFGARVNKTGFDIKLTCFNKQITSNKTKHLGVQKKLNSQIAKDYNFFLGKISFYK